METGARGEFGDEAIDGRNALTYTQFKLWSRNAAKGVGALWNRKDPKAVSRVIRQSLTVTTLEPCAHAVRELANDGLDMNDVRHIIRHGKLRAIEGKRFRWQGPPIDTSDVVEVVLEIDNGQAVTIVTVFKVDVSTRR